MAKNYQHQMVMDFDTDAILAWMAANPLSGAQYYQYELYVNINSGWGVAPGSTVNVRTLNSNSDWDEGDGDGSYTFYNWTADTGASVYEYAQCYWKDDGAGGRELDDTKSVEWQEEDGTAVSNLLNLPYSYQNAVDLVASEDDDLTYVSVVLDDDGDATNMNWLIEDLLNNDKNRGLRFWSDTYANKAIYTKDNAGTSRDPYVEVTIVPEPVTLGLLGLGFVGLIAVRRRRK
jgi:hypothetical protein